MKTIEEESSKLYVRGRPRTFITIFAALSTALLFLLVFSSTFASAESLAEDDADDLYAITVDLPAEPVRNVVVSLTLPSGLIYDDSSLVVSGAVTSALAEVIGPNDGASEVPITWSFGDVDNSLDRDIQIRFRAVVTDVSSNQNGANLEPGKAALRFDDSEGTSQSSFGESLPVAIVEPDLRVEKSATSSIGGDGNARIAYEVNIYHSPISSSGAFDVEVFDSVSPGLVLVPGSAKIVSGPEGGQVVVLDSDLLKWQFDEIDLSWSEGKEVVLVYEAAVSDGLGRDDAEIGAAGSLTWTSTEGENPDERHYLLLFDETGSKLSISIDPNPANPNVGDLVRYTYTVRNTGGDEIEDLSLKAGTAGRMRPISLEKDRLFPGEEVTATAEDEVTEADLPGPLENFALALGKDHLGNPVTGAGQISIGLLDFEVDKTAEKSTVRPGGLLNYTIALCNRGTVPVENVMVKDVFNREVEFVSVDPAPSEGNNVWRFLIIPQGCTYINLTIRVPRQDFEFWMAQGIKGEGFVNVANDYNTAPPSSLLTNCVYVNFTSRSVQGTISDCEKVTVVEPGTELYTREHGSGSYDGEEQLRMATENRSLEMEKDISATHAETALGLYRNRTVTYSSLWTESAEAKNKVTGATMSESYRYASYIDKESRMKLDENESAMEINAEFEGMGHIGFLKIPANATPKTSPILESREDYAGSFRILERIDEYGLGASSEKSASGSGSVIADKRVGEGQRTYESGSGTYSSDEIIETYSNYIAKDISVVFTPSQQNLTEDVAIDQSMRWKEGIYSKTPGTSLIGEEYTSATYLDKETVARGLNEMETEAEFSGRARYRAVYYNALTNESKNATSNVSESAHAHPAIEIDEIYEGDYSIARKILISGAPKYDRPHLSVTKTLDGISEETIPWGYGEPHLEGEEKIIKVATYTIRIENDGNGAVGPVYVQDLFPPGATYFGASLRPVEVTIASANWTLTHLAIGDVAAIEVELDATDCTGPELVNRIEVCGGMGEDQVCASNFSAQEMDWLTCCTDETVSVKKTGEVDGADQTVVWYKIEIKNHDNATRAATVTDHLPERMVLLDTMVPFASYDGRTITWNLVEIGPGETVTIAYRTQAQHAGRFVNTVEVDTRSVDGPVVQPARASSIVLVGELSECEPTSCDLWSPPNWDFEYVGYYAPNVACEEWTPKNG